MNLVWPIDRSRIVAFQDCPRKRYWSYHHGGKGIRRKENALPLVTGIAVHQALEGFLIGLPVDEAIAGALSSYSQSVEEKGLQHGIKPEPWFLKEQLWMLECVMRAWHHHRLPKILEEYEVVSVEQEVTNNLLPWMPQMVRLDALVRHRQTQALEILEFKTCSYPSFDWGQQWERNVQILANTLAVEATRGDRCEGVKIEGIVKGMRKTETAASSPFNGKRIQASPYCYAYRSQDDFGNPAYSKEYKAGKAWRKVALYDEPGLTPEQWVATFTSSELDDLFVPLPAIRPVPSQMARWERQTVEQEKRLAAALARFNELNDAGLRDEAEMVLDAHFPLHDSACKKYGSSCEFEDACFDETIGSDPVGSGLYEERTPHHATEIEEG